MHIQQEFASSEHSRYAFPRLKKKKKKNETQTLPNYSDVLIVETVGIKKNEVCEGNRSSKCL